MRWTILLSIFVIKLSKYCSVFLVADAVRGARDLHGQAHARAFADAAGLEGLLINHLHEPADRAPVACRAWHAERLLDARKDPGSPHTVGGVEVEGLPSEGKCSPARRRRSSLIKSGCSGTELRKVRCSVVGAVSASGYGLEATASLSSAGVRMITRGAKPYRSLMALLISSAISPVEALSLRKMALPLWMWGLRPAAPAPA